MKCCIMQLHLGLHSLPKYMYSFLGFLVCKGLINDDDDDDDDDDYNHATSNLAIYSHETSPDKLSEA